MEKTIDAITTDSNLTELLNSLGINIENVYILYLTIGLFGISYIVIVFIIIYMRSNKRKIKHLQNLVDTNKNNINELASKKQKNIKHSTKEDIELYNSIKNSFDVIMKEKMDFYFHKFFLPVYVGRKEISKTLITEIKEKFYTDVMVSTPEFIKNDLKEMYGVKSFDAYILQFYFNYLNRVDRKLYKSLDNITDNEMKDILELGKY